MSFTYPTLTALSPETPRGLYKIGHEAYHDGPGISSSDIKNALVSYGYYAYKKEADEEPRPSLEFGKAFHMALLEYDLFADTYRVAPDVDRRTKDGKAKWADFLAELGGSRRAISADDWESIFTLTRAVREHPRWTDVGNLSAEIAAIAPCATHGIRKCKPDLLGSAIIDVKTTICAAPWEFNKAVTRFGYHISAAFYQDVIKEVTGESLPFVFIVVEKKPPFGVAFYTLSDEYLREGRLLYQAGLARISKWDNMPPERRALHYGSSIQVLTPTAGTLYRTKDLIEAIQKEV